MLKAALRGPRTNRPAAPASAAELVAELDGRDYFSRAAGKEPGLRDAWPPLLKVSKAVPLDPQAPLFSQYGINMCRPLPYTVLDVVKYKNSWDPCRCPVSLS